MASEAACQTVVMSSVKPMIMRVAENACCQYVGKNATEGEVRAYCLEKNVTFHQHPSGAVLYQCGPYFANYDPLHRDNELAISNLKKQIEQKKLEIELLEAACQQLETGQV